MPRYRVHYERPVSTVVDVEADTPEKAIDAGFQSDRFPGGVVSTGGSDVNEAGDWEAYAVYDDATDEEVWRADD